MNSCFWCGKTSQENKPCLRCNGIYYCSDNHYAYHKERQSAPTDGWICRPFIVSRSPEKGRYLVATREIKPFESLFSETPFIVGPSRQHRFVCLECLEDVDESNMYLCPACNFPVCNDVCALEGKWHAPLECSYFQRKGLKAASASEIPQLGKIHKLLLQIAAVTPLRFLLLSQTHNWNEERKLHSVEADRKDRSYFLEMDMAKTIMNDFETDFDEAIIHLTLRQLFNNAKSLEKNGNNSSGLYFLYSLMNHNCISNTKSIIHSLKDSDTPGLMEVRALRCIQSGEEISTRYVGSNVGHPTRREILLEHWGFVCLCARCEDPTELGTFTSAIKCPHCSEGYLLPPSNMTKEWDCNGCSETMSKADVRTIINENTEKIRTVTRSRVPNVDSLRHLIAHLKETFHENHFLVLQVEYVLIILISNKTTGIKSLIKDNNNSSSILNSSSIIWQEYNDICHHIYSVMNEVDPGYSKNRGSILKEYIRAIMNLATIQKQIGSINEGEFTKRKQFAKYLSKELIGCFKHEKFTKVISPL